MDKKLFIVLLVFVGIFVGFYLYINQDNFKEKNDNSNKKNNTKRNIVSKIDNINTIELYKTDFKDNQYIKVNLTEEQISKLKESLNNFNLDNTKKAIVYGKYKLVIDDKIILFDPNNDYGLYMETNKEILFPNTIKQIIINDEKLCSCCVNNNCNINLCSCNN